MGKVSYQTRGEPAVEQLLNTAINPATLAAGDGLIWDATNEIWINGAGGGGGGVVGNDDQVLFKQAGVANTFTQGVSRNPAAPLMTMNLDTTNRRVGIKQQNPAVELDVGGIAQLTSGAHTLKIEGNEVGVSAGANSLKLYSSNDTSNEASTLVDGAAKSLIVGGTMRTREPVAFDAMNSSEKNGLYKIKLNVGMDKEPGGGAFDIQEDYDPAALGFPTGQITEYQNKMNLVKPMIMGRIASGVSITPASVYVISGFGNTFAFKDRAYYDPMQMRSRKSGNGWVWAGAPTIYRVPDLKVGWTIKWYFEGAWAVDDPLNRCDMYINQFRNGVLLRAYLVARSNNASSCFLSGQRTFNTWTTAFGEDFDVMTDDWQIEIANMTGAGVNIVVGLGQVELECWLAQ